VLTLGYKKVNNRDIENTRYTGDVRPRGLGMGEGLWDSGEAGVPLILPSMDVSA